MCDERLLKNALILSVDQGTTGTRAILFNTQLQPVGQSYKEHAQLHPRVGWVEHDPLEILGNITELCQSALEQACARGYSPADVRAMGIANQGETVMAWNRHTGKLYTNAIVWQCRRAEYIVERWKQDDEFARHVRQSTGLRLDAYFSAAKIVWLIEHVTEIQTDLPLGNVCFGTFDAYLIWQLTGSVFKTDSATASRTMLMNLEMLDWDEVILEKLGIPKASLPTICDSSCDFGVTDPDRFINLSVPIAGSIVDQQGALLGQGCFSKGESKVTYGTGSFVLMNIGERPVTSSQGLLTSVGWSIGGQLCYVLEGGVFISGAALQWLRDGLGLIQEYAQIDSDIQKTEDTGGVCFVPAFTGLGPPHWDPYARGAMLGLTAYTRREHILRAAIEAIAIQVFKVYECLQADTGIEPRIIKADGGVSNSLFLLQTQANLLGRRVIRAANQEATALGAAILAGLAVKLWDGLDEIKPLLLDGHVIYPDSKADCQSMLDLWERAVSRAVGWAQ